MTNKNGFALVNNYIHLHHGAGAHPVPVGEDFWQTIGERTELMEGRLCGLVHVEEVSEVTTKEMHPEGDEILFLHTGRMDVILMEADGEKTIPLKAGDWALVPRGVWHTIKVHKPADVLFIAPGKGTESKPL